MATCPRCYEYLGERHVCRGQTGRALRTGLGFLTAAVIGGTAGVAVLGLVGGMLGMANFEAVGLVAGSVGAVIVQRFTRVPYN